MFANRKRQWGQSSRTSSAAKEQVVIARRKSLEIAAWMVIGSLSVCSLIGIVKPNGAKLLAAAPIAAEEKNVRELEDQVHAAVVQGDVETFDRLFAEDFTHTSRDGKFRTRAEWMKGRVQGKTNYVSFDVENQQIRIYGETAVVTGLSKPSWREPDGSLATGQFRFLRVWVMREGRWQAVAFQATRISDEKK
jgi:ketosteroid isomerase-like protein